MVLGKSKNFFAIKKGGGERERVRGGGDGGSLSLHKKIKKDTQEHFSLRR